MNVVARLRPVAAVLVVLFVHVLPAHARTPEASDRVPMISGGAEAALLAPTTPPDFVGPLAPGQKRAPDFPSIGFDAYGFDDNVTLTGGSAFIPPDPIGAAGPDRVISVTNVGIECRDKNGVLLFRDSLRNFFAPAPMTLGTFTFDPKIVWDDLAGRFVVVTLERTDVGAGAPSNQSRILLAASRTATPASATLADWVYYGFDSKLNIGGTDVFADYPGFEVDEEAVYLCMNYFNFSTGAATYGMRLWIVDKLALYAGLAPTVTLHDPYSVSGVPGLQTTTMPAMVSAPGGVGPGVGTFLVSYSGLTFGGPGANEALCVIRVDDPLGAVSFVQEFVTIGDIEDVGGTFGFPPLPDAPQAGGPALIEVNDRRLLDAEWRDGRLWACTTIEPNASDPANQGQTTAHWFELDASGVTSSASPAGLISLVQEGNCGGEDVEPGLFTFFPAIAVNPAGEMLLGFSGSGANSFGSAYLAGRVPAEPPGFTGPTGLVRQGVDYYLRTLGGPRNRWGDYSGVALDPANPSRFWVFNEFADLRGTPIGGEDGRWKTAWVETGFGPLGNPDLIVTAFRAPCCVAWDRDLAGKFFVEVANVDVVGSPATQLTLRASPDPAIDLSDPLLNGGVLPIPPLGPGTSLVIGVPGPVSLPGGLLNGPIFLGAIVDDPNVVVESDETNNTASLPAVAHASPVPCLNGQAFAALQGAVSVFTIPDGSGDPLNAAQQFQGVGVPPLPYDATIVAELFDKTGAPATGILTTLASTQGNLVLCPGQAAADGPTDGLGFATFSGPLFGGGWTRSGELLLVLEAGGAVVPGMVYGFPEMLATDRTGLLHRIDPFVGASAPLCPVSATGGSTEIEWVVDWAQGWVQDVNGNFQGNTFDSLACGPTSGPIPTNGLAFNGLEWIRGRLWGTGIPGQCAPSDLWVLDPPAGAYTLIGPTGAGPITGLAWDPICDRLYGTTGCTNNLGPTVIVEIDRTTGLATPLFNTGTQLGSLEFDFRGRLLAIGGQTDGANLYEVDLVNHTLIPIGPTGVLPGGTGLTLASDGGIAIAVNSPDVNGDLIVNLSDVGTFAAAYGNASYDYLADFSFDGVENIADVGKFAPAVGAVCPGGPRIVVGRPDRTDAELVLAFDPSGTRRRIARAEDTAITAYLVARGAVVNAGVRAWEARIAGSDNVVIDDVVLADGSLDVGRAGDRIVGLATARSGDDAVVLATLRLHVTDEAPATLRLDPVEASSTQGQGPALVGADDPDRVRTAFVTDRADGVAATINPSAVETVPAPVAMRLRAAPNPFNPTTTFHFGLESAAPVEVRIFDASGRHVRTMDAGVASPGPQTLVWKGEDDRGVTVTSGTYFARLVVDGIVRGPSEKLTLLK